MFGCEYYRLIARQNDRHGLIVAGRDIIESRPGPGIIPARLAGLGDLHFDGDQLKIREALTRH